MKVGKFLAVLVFSIIFFVGNCFAMNFSQKIKIGEIMTDTAGFSGNGYIFKEVSYNSGKERIAPNLRKRTSGQIPQKSYGEGIARFGDGENALYLYYDMNNRNYNNYPYDEKIGGKNIENTVGVPIGEGTIIFQIENDSKTKIYIIFSGYAESADCFIFGKTPDGKFVKYVDTRNITKQYLGTNSLLMVFYNFREMSFNKDIIIIPYIATQIIRTKTTDKREITEGEFLFKWDEAAQWFSIEKVAY